MTKKYGDKDAQKDLDKIIKIREEQENLGIRKKKLMGGGRVEYKSGGGVGCAKRGFNKKILKKGKK